MRVLFYLLLYLSICTTPAFSELSPPPIIGELREIRLESETTLMEVAVAEGVGFMALRNANPDIDPWLPETGTPLTLPTQAIFPGQPATGLTINLAEQRLYHLVDTQFSQASFYPLGIGREGWETPEGNFYVITRKKDPIWRPPAAIRKEHPRLPEFVPPGPGNPLGEYWLGLSIPGYGLHGTNRPQGVGRRISHGCIRLYDQDIQDLYDSVAVGEQVRILYQPTKASVLKGQLVLEAHPDYLSRFPDMFQEALAQISKLGWGGHVNYPKVLQVVTEQRGIPVVVGWHQ